jgi:hypothetical protein
VLFVGNTNIIKVSNVEVLHRTAPLYLMYTWEAVQLRGQPQTLQGRWLLELPLCMVQGRVQIAQCNASYTRRRHPLGAQDTGTAACPHCPTVEDAAPFMHTDCQQVAQSLPTLQGYAQ